MSDIAILREMIKDTAIVPISQDRYKNKVTLEEKEEKKTNQKSNYTFDILGLPAESNVIVIKVDDSFKSPDNIFHGYKGECKRCDYVIVADLDREKIIIFIELKGGESPGNSHIIKQFKGGICFLRYCQEIGRIFWERPDFLKEYEYRFVSMLKIVTSRKRPTGYRGMDEINDTPEKMLHISHQQDIQFRMLYQIHPDKKTQSSK
jgi:hypothetical protein